MNGWSLPTTTGTLTLAIALAAAGCNLGGPDTDTIEGAALGEPCTVGEQGKGQSLLTLELGNSGCATDACLSFNQEQYCTKGCSTLADCPEGMMCMPLEPLADGAYCIIFQSETDHEPSEPVPGSARYHADEIIRFAQENWAPDAYVMTVMSGGIGTDGLRQGEAEWTYELMANSRPGMMISLTVTEEGVEEYFRERERSGFGPDPVDLISTDMWRYDSHDLIELARQHGADEFLAKHPGAVAVYSLSPGVIMNQPTAIWNFSLADRDTWDSRGWMFDARTGEKIF